MLQLRAATAADAPFLAWVIEAAGRSQLDRGLWEVLIPDGRAEALLAFVTSPYDHLGHWARFLVAEEDGVPLAALAAGDPQEHSEDFGVLMATLEHAGWPAEARAQLWERSAALDTLGYAPSPGAWLLDYVATRPGARGRGLASALIAAALEEGAWRGYRRAQLGLQIGNLPALRTYQRAGFVVVEEHRSEAFARDFGAPGMWRVERAVTSPVTSLRRAARRARRRC